MPRMGGESAYFQTETIEIDSTPFFILALNAHKKAACKFTGRL